MELSVTKKEVIEYKKLEIISHIASIKSKIELFESKYGCKFEDFEKKLKERQDEDFEEWDDYIEWKAYVKTLEELREKLKEIENAKDVRIA
ncbi:conserved hypothetical protein [Ferroglobus placidus DSM 10642]|uniref:Uncharacterized protein n=1 Tax=Ferroglobus placidus (strain DSM 10642 / AEDII12DO) TaxID=589924 RepID=D3S2T2_FERPA|nr:hypothetical protein [Ferroglobus placidus]ADC66644.1 conserved hypothetical protein [Ferroglobus placidus DSM 10642]